MGKGREEEEEGKKQRRNVRDVFLPSFLHVPLAAPGPAGRPDDLSTYLPIYPYLDDERGRICM